MLIPAFLQRFCLLHTLIMKSKYNWPANFSFLFQLKIYKEQILGSLILNDSHNKGILPAQVLSLHKGHLQIALMQLIQSH